MNALIKKENPMLENVRARQAASDIAKVKNCQQTTTEIYCFFSKSAKLSQGLEKRYRTFLKCFSQNERSNPECNLDLLDIHENRQFYVLNHS